MSMQQKRNIIFSLIFVIITLGIVGGLVYYLTPTSDTPAQSEPDPNDYFTLTIVSDDLAEEEIASYQQRFSEVVTEIQTIPDFVNPWFELGQIKKNVGDFRGAEAAWLNANKIRPNNSTSYGNLADLYTNFLIDYDKALVSYQQAIQNSQDEFLNVQFYRRLYEFYLYNLKDLGQAEAVLLQGVEDNPADSELSILLAQFYRDELDDTQKAIQYFELALKNDPTDELVKQDLDALKNQ